MPRSLKLTVMTEEGATSLIEVLPTTEISVLATVIQLELSIPSDQQLLRFKGSTLSLSATIASSGLSDGDLILVSRKPAPARSAPARSAPSRQQPANSADAARALAHAMGNIAPGGQRGHYVDPMSADAQKAIEERIRQQNVMQNMEAAIEYNPESFGSVVMLFIDCKVNSVSGVKAFVDSGAQATIISKECAEHCNILRLLDSRFEGMAHGVGTAKIYGRIHLALLTLGSEVFEVSFTVMDAIGGEYDMLLGLDMLRKHQASIDLANNCLRIGNSQVPFLAEKDIPKKMLSQRGRQGEPSSSFSPPASTRPSSSPSRSRARTTSAPRTQSSPSRSTGRSRAQDEALARLIELGFPSSESEEALRVCGGDADQAAAMLASKKYGF